MTWNVLLQHPFWNARPTPPEADIPPQPLFEASVQKFHTERRRSMERKQRVTVSSSSSADGQGDSRNSNSNGTEQEYENGRDQGESSEEYEENRRSLDQSNTMRMSRIARENLERDQSRDTYGASSSFHKNNEDDVVGGRFFLALRSGLHIGVDFTTRGFCATRNDHYGATKKITFFEVGR